MPMRHVVDGIYCCGLQCGLFSSYSLVTIAASRQHTAPYYRLFCSQPSISVFDAISAKQPLSHQSSDSVPRQSHGSKSFGPAVDTSHCHKSDQSGFNFEPFHETLRLVSSPSDVVLQFMHQASQFRQREVLHTGRLTTGSCRSTAGSSVKGWHSIASLALMNVDRFNAAQLGTLARCMGRCSYRDPVLLQSLCEGLYWHSLARQVGMDALCDVLESLVTLRYRPSLRHLDVWVETMRQTESQRRKFCRARFAVAMLQFVVKFDLHHKLRDTQMATDVFDLCLEEVGNMRSHELSKFLRVITVASSNVNDRAGHDGLPHKTVQHPVGSNCDSVSPSTQARPELYQTTQGMRQNSRGRHAVTDRDIFWSTNAHWIPVYPLENVFERICDNLARGSAGLSTAVLMHISRTLIKANLRQLPEAYMRVLRRHTVENLSTLSPQELTFFSRLLNKYQRREPFLLDRIGRAAESNVDKLTIRQQCTILTSLRGLRYKHTRLATTLKDYFFTSACADGDEDATTSSDSTSSTSLPRFPTICDSATGKVIAANERPVFTNLSGFPASKKPPGSSLSSGISTANRFSYVPTQQRYAFGKLPNSVHLPVTSVPRDVCSHHCNNNHFVDNVSYTGAGDITLDLGYYDSCSDKHYNAVAEGRISDDMQRLDAALRYHNNSYADRHKRLRDTTGAAEHDTMKAPRVVADVEQQTLEDADAVTIFPTSSRMVSLSVQQFVDMRTMQNRIKSDVSESDEMARHCRSEDGHEACVNAVSIASSVAQSKHSCATTCPFTETASTSADVGDNALRETEVLAMSRPVCTAKHHTGVIDSYRQARVAEGPPSDRASRGKIKSRKLRNNILIANRQFSCVRRICLDNLVDAVKKAMSKKTGTKPHRTTAATAETGVAMSGPVSTGQAKAEDRYTAESGSHVTGSSNDLPLPGHGGRRLRDSSTEYRVTATGVVVENGPEGALGEMRQDIQNDTQSCQRPSLPNPPTVHFFCKGRSAHPALSRLRRRQLLTHWLRLYEPICKRSEERSVRAYLLHIERRQQLAMDSSNVDSWMLVGTSDRGRDDGLRKTAEKVWRTTGMSESRRYADRIPRRIMLIRKRTRQALDAKIDLRIELRQQLTGMKAFEVITNLSWALLPYDGCLLDTAVI
eukprot:GHVQ01023661.1.p1 GENE.GHVQ01023661.1~~GHVQ01023661.1.p1  ORF type:complete len:1144 (-),score=132.32 GHVQ01023661.1:973-4404(-)